VTSREKCVRSGEKLSVLGSRERKPASLPPKPAAPDTTPPFAASRSDTCVRKCCAIFSQWRTAPGQAPTPALSITCGPGDSIALASTPGRPRRRPTHASPRLWQRFSRGSRSLRCSHGAVPAQHTSRPGPPLLTLRSVGPARERTPSPTVPSTVRVEGCLGRTSFGFSAFYSSCLTSLSSQPPIYSDFPSSPVEPSSSSRAFQCASSVSETPASSCTSRQQGQARRTLHPRPCARPNQPHSTSYRPTNSPTANRSVFSWTFLPWSTLSHTHTTFGVLPHTAHYSLHHHHSLCLVMAICAPAYGGP
jgi:hypothetical protein